MDTALLIIILLAIQSYSTYEVGQQKTNRILKQIKEKKGQKSASTYKDSQKTRLTKRYTTYQQWLKARPTD